MINRQKFRAPRTPKETKPAQQQNSSAENRKSLAVGAIQAHLAAHGRLLPNDYERVGRSVGLQAQSISFALGDLVSAGQVDPRRVEDVHQQAPIRRHLPAAIQSAGTDRLKPLKEELERLCGAPIDYVQLRVELLRTGHLQPATSSRPASDSPPSFWVERVRVGGSEREGVSRARRSAFWGVQR